VESRLVFKPKMRVKKRGDFERAYRQGARARGAIVALVVCPNGLPHARLGLSVGRAIWKSAVRRNRIRRIFREAFRLSYAELPPGVDVIMIPAAPKLDPKLADTRAELVALAHKAERRASDPNRPRRKAGGAK
jgi:ribonuclease P protein component